MAIGEALKTQLLEFQRSKIIEYHTFDVGFMVRTVLGVDV